MTSLPKDVNQKLATLVHTQWSIWQEYQDKHKIQNNAGTVEFTDGTWQNWNRLSNTPFKFLTKEEQKSDLEIAEKLWMPFLVEVLSEERKSLERRIADFREWLEQVVKIAKTPAYLEKFLEVFGEGGQKKEEHSPLCRVMKNLYPEKWEQKKEPKK